MKMETIMPINKSSKESLYKTALRLAEITILYNLVEGFISVFFGIVDETISLAGFGLDSFVEVISGAGIIHMVRRIRLNPESDPDRYEKTALRITGISFYLLSAGLMLTAIFNIITGHHPETTFWGMIIGIVSIVTMSFLIYFKKKVGNQLNSDAILEDANCTRACLYLSLILLIASTVYELTGFGGVDSVGAILIAVLAFREGKESLEKAEGKGCRCCDDG